MFKREIGKQPLTIQIPIILAYLKDVYAKMNKENMHLNVNRNYLLFNLSLSSETAGESGTDGDEIEVWVGGLSSTPSSNGMQEFCLTNMP